MFYINTNNLRHLELEIAILIPVSKVMNEKRKQIFQQHQS